MRAEAEAEVETARLASTLHALARALQPSSSLTLLRPRRHPSSTLGHGDVETQTLLLHRASERRDVQHPPFFFFFLQKQHPPCRSTSPAAAAEEAAAATRRMSAAAAPAAIACALFSFTKHSANSPRTVLNLGRLMAGLEGTEAAYCTASGMSAIAAVLLQLISAGGHVVASKCLYGGTHAFLSRAYDIRATFVDANDTHAVRAAVHEGDTKGEGGEAGGGNTFTPMVVSPARLRVDVVIHSVSKFISGGADIIAGY
uniref:Methionine gamma-lyase n=1 Tax=Ananas comosus var. bracteatus TaxID=296719 RepID=A0A6V7NUS6_ANACO|nr:unnamed protein product [Ananas comosus var. bracteatus]